MEKQTSRTGGRADPKVVLETLTSKTHDLRRTLGASMAIESLYWKEELARIVKAIRPVTKPKRWSERAVCTVERDVMIGFFIVRRMIELHKVSSRVAKLQLDVYSAPVTKTVTKVNRFSVEENYDWQAEKAERKPVLYVCNRECPIFRV